MKISLIRFKSVKTLIYYCKTVKNVDYVKIVINRTPSDIIEPESEAAADLLPDKSKKVYEICYRRLIDSLVKFIVSIYIFAE